MFALGFALFVTVGVFKAAAAAALIQRPLKLLTDRFFGGSAPWWLELLLSITVGALCAAWFSELVYNSRPSGLFGHSLGIIPGAVAGAIAVAGSGEQFRRVLKPCVLLVGVGWSMVFFF